MEMDEKNRANRMVCQISRKMNRCRHPRPGATADIRRQQEVLERTYGRDRCHLTNFASHDQYLATSSIEYSPFYNSMCHEKSYYKYIYAVKDGKI
jgi:hypothetical protein